MYESVNATTVSLVYPLTAYSGLVRFYDDALVGWIRSRTDVEGSRSCEYSRDSSTVVVNVCIDTESDGYEIDATCVAITQVRQGGAMERSYGPHSLP